jgi:hypothetical protein
VRQRLCHNPFVQIRAIRVSDRYRSRVPCCFAGWLNRNQQNVIEYLQEQVKVLKEQLGKKPSFTDDRRRRLAADSVRARSSWRAR